ncbi:MAG TPA: riboflavin synthase [Solirubrobacteraceae bacterium]|jgi:riboflavin synthase|nr:riboflavin synthase [Solirubrobacteraceae bacterium]
MFTGLIADLGTVLALDPDGGERGVGVNEKTTPRARAREGAGMKLRIATRLAGELREGDSIAVNGVCLTATDLDGEGFAAEAMLETLRRSSLGTLEVGSTVNLELALRADGRLGGHVVQGHVDGTGRIAEIRPEGFARVLRIDAEPALLRYLVEKGSIAVDGVSLTVSALHGDGFSVSLIPETLTRTTLGRAVEGRTVNLEVDVLAKHVERLLQTSA